MSKPQPKAPTKAVFKSALRAACRFLILTDGVDGAKLTVGILRKAVLEIPPAPYELLLADELERMIEEQAVEDAARRARAQLLGVRRLQIGAGAA